VFENDAQSVSVGVVYYLCPQKFYRTMSEIKSDVEYVVKTGRQIVEKKQVDFPGTLTSQIDAIKQQYNRLGSQVFDL
jgi:hypothetical protein